jgi:gluconolactonase
MSRSLSLAVALLVAPVVAADGPFDPAAKVEKLAGGFKFTEGCASDKDGNVYFTDQPNDRIHMWSADGKLSTFLEKSGRSNGLCVDAAGTLWACADEKNELWKIDPATKKAEVLVKDFKGKRLNGPNDIWVTPTGGAYFTDPLYQRPYWPKAEVEREKRGVYFYSPKGELTRVADDLTQPNGIIGTADGKTLYVADINARKTYRYAIGADGTLADKTLFCEKGSDGMTLDADGNVYLTSGAVWVFDQTGKQVAELKVPESPSNVCFGGKDRKTLFITARTGLYAIRCTVAGVGSQ